MSKEDQIKYPGAEGFWRQSPELIPLQEDLGKLWQSLEETPSFPEAEITSRGEGDVIAVRTRNSQYESYHVYELGSTPRIEDRYPKKPYALMPRIADDQSEAQIKLYLEKWTSGYRVNGEPVVRGFDWVDFVHQGEAEFKLIPEHLRNEGVRLVALKMMARAEQQKPEEVGRSQRVLDIVKGATGDA